MAYINPVTDEMIKICLDLSKKYPDVVISPIHPIYANTIHLLSKYLDRNSRKILDVGSYPGQGTLLIKK